MNSTVSASLKIVELSKEHSAKYEAFLLQRKDALFYYSLKYKQLLELFLGCEVKHLLAIDDSGEIKGALPLAYKSGPLGTVVNSLPFYGSNAGVISSDEPALKALTQTYNAVANDSSFASVTYIENPLSDKNNFGITHDIIDYRIGQFTNINFTENIAEKLMESFHFKTRNVIRKAMKEDYTIEVDNSAWDFLVNVHHENMAAINGKAKPAEFFECIRKVYEAGKDFRIYVAKANDGQIASALLLFLYNDIVEYYTPVIKAEFRSSQALSHIIYEAMIQLAGEGYKLWNWGGTWKTQDGVYRFKSRWNANDLNYNYYTKINNKEIYNATTKELLEHYPYFFVIPFDKLNSNTSI